MTWKRLQESFKIFASALQPQPAGHPAVLFYDGLVAFMLYEIVAGQEEAIIALESL